MSSHFASMVDAMVGWNTTPKASEKSPKELEPEAELDDELDIDPEDDVKPWP